MSERRSRMWAKVLALGTLGALVLAVEGLSVGAAGRGGREGASFAVPVGRSATRAHRLSKGNVRAPLAFSYDDSVDDDYIPFLPDSNCFSPTEYTSIFHSASYNISQCFYDSPQYSLYVPREDLPLPCIRNVTTELVFNDGSFSADQTFYNCLANVDDSGTIPTFYNGSYHGCTFISTVMTLLNLVKLDEISGTADLQFIMDYRWTDLRYAMPAFWANIDRRALSSVDLTNLLTNDSVVMWLPEVVFPDASDVVVQSATLMLSYPANFVYRVVYDMSLVQPGFDFTSYPNDDQTLVIRTSVMNYDADELQLFPGDIVCSYLPDHTCTFSHNAVWSWDESRNYCTAYVDASFGSDLRSAFMSYQVTVDRSSGGVLVRLVVPLMLMILLSVLTFWIAYENRVDTTITLLLATSALYIVILQNIPMVGYLTDVDRFVFAMFVLLCCIVALHQVYATIREKAGRWPLRPVYLRAIEMVGRCAVLPVVLFYFSLTVQFSTADGGASIIASGLVVCGTILYREVFGMRSTLVLSMKALVEKVNEAGLSVKDLSTPETIALNVWIFRVLSRDKVYISRHLAEEGPIEVDWQQDVALDKVFSLNALLGRPSRTNVRRGRPNSVSAPKSFATAGDASGEAQEPPQFRRESAMGVAMVDMVANPIVAESVREGSVSLRHTLSMQPDSDDEEDRGQTEDTAAELKEV